MGNPDKRMRQKVVIEFRHGLFPTGRPGRKRKEVVTAAYCDWRDGLRGPELYRKHIPNYASHNYYRRRVEARRLMSAIHARQRREKNPKIVAVS
jgi:hypothetical protein